MLEFSIKRTGGSSTPLTTRHPSSLLERKNFIWFLPVNSLATEKWPWSVLFQPQSFMWITAQPFKGGTCCRDRWIWFLEICPNCKCFATSTERECLSEEESPPVHDVGQSVHVNWVSGQQGWVKNSRWRHHHEGKPVLQEHITHLG